jgi:hypothetical protein
MVALSVEIDQFLDTVARVSELEAAEAALADEEERLFPRLDFAEQMDWTDTIKRLGRELYLVTRKRRDLGAKIAKARACAGLQVLGRGLALERTRASVADLPCWPSVIRALATVGGSETSRRALALRTPASRNRALRQDRP